MIRLPLILLLALALSSCAKSPLGRRQLTIFPDSEMSAMGVAAFDEIKGQTPRSKDPATNAYVRCVATAVTAAVDPKDGPGRWEVVVFEDPAANAFALPGGKIGVFTGLLDVARSDDQLATVLGHEVAHVLADHGNERMSTTFAAQAGLQAVQVFAGGSSETSDNVMAVLGVGAQVGVLLPFSRAQESEADLLGLDLMASAGFEPSESVELWRNMAKAGGGQPPQFLSTHPSHESRIRELQERIPRASRIQSNAQTHGKKPDCRR